MRGKNLVIPDVTQLRRRQSYLGNVLNGVCCAPGHMSNKMGRGELSDAAQSLKCRIENKLLFSLICTHKTVYRINYS